MGRSGSPLHPTPSSGLNAIFSDFFERIQAWQSQSARRGIRLLKMESNPPSITYPVMTSNMVRTWAVGVLGSTSP